MEILSQKLFLKKKEKKIYFKYRPQIGFSNEWKICCTTWFGLSF